ncbi:hypothetical protein ABGB16_32975, partial [Micromonospora sp. B11E3]
AAIGSAVDSGTASRPGAASGPAGSSGPADLGLAAAHGPAAERIHDLASGGHGRATDAQLRRLAADIGIQAASPDEVLPQLFEASRGIAMADTFSGVYFADPAVADLDAAAADRTAAQALPRVDGWFTIAGHRNLAERLADDPVRQALFLRTLTASPAWQHAVAQAQQRGGDTPDIMLVWCDAAWQGPGQATPFGEWLRTKLRARRLMSSTHEVDQIPGELRPHADEPARSVLFSDASVELFGPDLVEAVRTADIVENGQEPGVHWPHQQAFTAAGGHHRWAGSTSDGQSPDPTENGDPSAPGPASAAQWVRDPSQDPGTELPSWPAPPAASSWTAGWTGPAEPDPGIDVTAWHGAAMSTDFGQDGGSGNLDDWAPYQGLDMDWQPFPAVTHTDADTLPAGDTLHHPADEPPTTPTPLPPDQSQPQPTAGSWVRDPDRARTLFNQHAGHIATTTQQQEQEQLRRLWNALIGSMDGDGFITVSERALARAAGTSQQTVHDWIVALRGRGLLRLVGGGHGRRAAWYKVTDPGPPRQASLPALPAGSQWVRDRNDARTLFEQHVGDIATTTQRDQLRRLWNVLIRSMDGEGFITASESTLADAASIPPSTVHDRIGELRGRGLLQLVREGHGGVAARYRVTDPGQPRQAPVPGPAPGPDRPQGSADLSWLNDGDTSPMPGPVPAPPADTDLPGLPGPLDDPNAPTASTWPEGWAGPEWPNPDIDVTAHGAGMSTNFGQPHTDNQPDGSGNPGAWPTWQMDPADLLNLLHPAWVGPPTAVDTEPAPGPQPTDPSRPQAPPGPTSWSQPSGDQPSQFPGTQPFPPGLGVQNPAPQSPMPGPVPAPPAGTGLPGLPGPLDDPNAPTASSWPAWPAASSWPAGWAGPAGPVPDIGATDGHGAAMSTPGQAGAGSGNLGAWATYQGTDMHWQPSPAPSPAVTRTDAGTLHPGDTLHHPADEPPTTPAPLHPDQPQPQPTAGRRWVRNPNDARTLFEQHVGDIATTTQQRDELRRLWNVLIGRMDRDGYITVSVRALAAATSTLPSTVHNRIGALRDHDLLQLVREAHGRVTARYRVIDPGQPRQALPALPAGSQWVRDPDDARTLFDQHVGHNATTTQRDQLRRLWNVLIRSMDGEGFITVSEPALAAATFTPQQTVNRRIGALRDRGLLQLVREAHGRVAARYRVTDPG